VNAIDLALGLLSTRASDRKLVDKQIQQLVQRVQSAAPDVLAGSSWAVPKIAGDIAEDFNLGGRGHKSLVKESGVSIRGR
jgi:hypothetical protein